ncbi:MAG: hypothetical protein ACLFN0_07350 [Thermovirgaceae bacterium]
MASVLVNDNLPARFGALLEDIFRLGLAQQGIPFHSVSRDVSARGDVRIDVILCFSPDMPELERFIKAQLIIDEKRSKSLRDADAKNFAPLEYVARLGPSRSKLPEWRPFEGKSFRISVNTSLGDVLHKALRSLPESPVSTDERKLATLGARLEEALEALYLKGTLPGSFDKAPVETDLPGTERPGNAEPDRDLEEFPEYTEDRQDPKLMQTPETWSEEDSEEEPSSFSLAAEEVLLFFETHPNVLDRWWSVASESDLELAGFDSKTSRPDSPGFRELLDFFRGLGLKDIHQVTDFIHERLGKWESLYEALETARIRGNLPSREMSVFEFALVLLKAQNRAA